MVVAEFIGGDRAWKQMKSFGLHVITGRWFMVFASLLIMAVAGATYMFGLYSNDVKTSQGYDQSTLNLLSFFKDLGGNVGVISGLINEITPPWVVLTIGAGMNFFGYFMIWLAMATVTVSANTATVAAVPAAVARTVSPSNSGDEQPTRVVY